MAQKSHRYVRGESVGGRQLCHMILCEVAVTKQFYLKGHLRKGDAMHDVSSLRIIWGDDFTKMVDFVSCPPAENIEAYDILFAEGLGGKARSGASVVNSEYISYHPYQCLPRYLIEYEI